MKIGFRQNVFRHPTDFCNEGSANSLLYHSCYEEVAKTVRREGGELGAAGKLATQGRKLEPGPFFVKDIGPAITARLVQRDNTASVAFSDYCDGLKVRAYAPWGKVTEFLASQSRVTEKANYRAFLFGSRCEDLTIFGLGYYSLTRWLFSKIIDLCSNIRKVMEVLKVAIEGADRDKVGVFGVVTDT